MISENDETTSQGIENDETKEDEQWWKSSKTKEITKLGVLEINKSSKARAFTKGKINNRKELK